MNILQLANFLLAAFSFLFYLFLLEVNPSGVGVTILPVGILSSLCAALLPFVQPKQ